MQWWLFRFLGGLVGTWIVWTLLKQFAGILFLLCTAIAAWRLWLTTSSRPVQHPVRRHHGVRTRTRSRPPLPRRRLGLAVSRGSSLLTLGLRLTPQCPSP